MTFAEKTVKAELAQELSKVEGFEEPRVSLEQYVTPPELAADILHSADMHGDLDGRKVLDLGTGTGIFAIGAALLGAEVVAVDKDPEALKIARENAEKLGVKDFIEFREEDVESIEGEFDTAVMNPPFSVHSEEGFKFLEKAFEVADVVYSVSHPGMRSRIKDFVANSDHRIEALEEYTVSLPPTYGFHTEDERETEVEVLVAR